MGEIFSQKAVEESIFSTIAGLQSSQELWSKGFLHLIYPQYKKWSIESFMIRGIVTRVLNSHVDDNVLVAFILITN